MRLAILTSHPIQYHVPLFQHLAARSDVESEVLFMHDHGVRPTRDRGFGRTIQYDIPLTDGYRHRFLWNISPKPVAREIGAINPEIIPILAGRKYDAVVVYGYTYLTSLFALLAPHLGPRVLLRGDSNPFPVRPLATRIAKQIALRPLFARVEHFLAVGARNGDYYASYGVPRHRITLAPHSVDNDYFRARSESARLNPNETRARFGLPADIPLFVLCGKLMSVKAPLDAVRAFAIARRSGPSGLVIVGDGALAADVRSEAEKLGVASSVFMLGFRNQSELPALYGACDALVLCSVLEAWGLVINEAMACGLAIAASDRVGAGPDLVVDNGSIFPAGDVDALARIFAGWIADPKLLARQRAASLERIKRWGIRETSDGFVEGARKAIAGRR